jgi:hypothetical protein
MRDDLREIMLRDERRRLGQLVESYITLYYPHLDESRDPVQDVLPNRHRDTRVTPDCWQRGLAGRTKGTAPELWNVDPEPSLKVTYADGTSTVVTHREFRRSARKRRDTAPQTNPNRAIRTDDPIFGNHDELASGDS